MDIWLNIIFFKSHTAFVMVFLANRDEMNDWMRLGFGFELLNGQESKKNEKFV